MAARKKLEFYHDFDEHDVFDCDSDTDPEYIQPSETSSGMDSENVEIRESDVSLASTRPSFNSPAKLPQSRKRGKNIKKCEKNKKRRNEGRQYTSTSGKQVEAASVGVMCKCPLKCFALTNEQILALFNGFWDMGDFDKQNAYLFSCIEAVPVKRRYKSKVQPSAQPYKNNTFIFRVKIAGRTHRVCKKSFLSVHGLHNHRGRVNNILKNIKLKEVTPTCDQRGKHQNRPNRASDEAIASVHNHIRSIPKYTSHYSRISNPKRVYFGAELNIKSLYELYIQFCSEKDMSNPVSEDKYRRIFNEQYNIGFKFPSTDTCKTCDSLQCKINNPGNDEEKDKAVKEKELHLRFAEAIRTKINEITNIAKSDNGVHLISIDLQQTLPTPKLTCGPAFYLRKLWTYNVGIHDCGKNLGYMLLWDESVATRGSDEIGSCLLKYIQSNNISARKLVVFSDNCAGQNKNWNIMALYTYLIQTKQFMEIEHYFLTSGHTYLPSDRDFAKIEKYQKVLSNVYAPNHWKEVILSCGKKSKFYVTQMVREDFYNISHLKQNLINSGKKSCVSGALLKFAEVVCFRFEAEHPWSIFLKHRINAEFDEYLIRKKGNIPQNLLIQKYKEPVKIKKAKFDDVMKLLDYIPPIYHNFYKNLKNEDDTTAEEIENID